MLVLTRKVATSLRIGDNVEITVLGIQGNTVRLGITAPREIPVLRGELHDRESRMVEITVDAARLTP
jgi:carbon storage regulator